MDSLRRLLPACCALASFILAIYIPCNSHFLPATPAHDSPSTPPRPPLIAPYPAFGFELSTSYGTVVVRHPNGSFHNGITINGSADFLAFMKRASVGRERCDGDSPKLRAQSHPPFLGGEDKQEHQEAVAVFTSLLGDLKRAIEATTSSYMQEAFVSSPKLPGLCNGQIIDALANLGVATKTNSRIHAHPHAVNAAYAAFRRGLCPDYTRRNPCEWQERWNLIIKRVMVATYTPDALLVEYSILSTAVGFIRQSESLIDWSAGSRALSTTPDPEVHWLKVVSLLLAQLARTPHLRYAVDVVVLAGLDGGDQTFKAVVNETFSRFQDPAPEILVFDDPTFTGARGAAEFAFRTQYQH